MQNEFRYDFQKGPHEISAGTVFTVFTCTKNYWKYSCRKKRLERFSKPNIRFGSGRTGSKIVSKFRLTHNRKLRSANRNMIDHTIACPALLLLIWCLALENRGCSKEVFFVKLCKSGGLLLSRPRSLVIPWPTPLAHSFTDDGHVPAENLLLK